MALPDPLGLRCDCLSGVLVVNKIAFTLIALLGTLGSASAEDTLSEEQLVRVAIEQLDELHELSLAEKAQIGKVTDFGINLDHYGHQIGPLTWQDVTAGRRGEGNLSISTHPDVAIALHIHEVTGHKKFDRENQGPFYSTPDMTSVTRFSGRWSLIRGSDGRVTGIRYINGAVESREFRGPTRD